MNKKSTTFVVHIDENGHWGLYCDGRCMVNPKEFTLHLRSGDLFDEADITWSQAINGCPLYYDGESVEVILHQKDNENNIINSKHLC